jgi:DNA-binding protein H-NS
LIVEFQKMNTNTELLSKRAQLLADLERLDKELAVLRESQRRESIARVLADIEASGLTQDDLFPRVAKKSPQTAKSRGLAPVKYRNQMTGDAWSGRGKRPRWLVAALAEGKTIEAFAV